MDTSETSIWTDSCKHSCLFDADNDIQYDTHNVNHNVSRYESINVLNLSYDAL